LPCDSTSTLLLARSATSRRSSHDLAADAASVAPSREADLGTRFPRRRACSVEAPLLWHVAETASFGRPDRRPLPPNRSGVQVGQAEDGPHGSGLAGATRPTRSAHAPVTQSFRSGFLVPVRPSQPSHAPPARLPHVTAPPRHPPVTDALKQDA
jgi:hypothetical protein